MNVPYNDETRAKIQEVGAKLLGSCEAADSIIEEVFGEEISSSDLDIQLLQELDDITQECATCNWWVETHELDDEQTCEQCQGEQQ